MEASLGEKQVPGRGHGSGNGPSLVQPLAPLCRGPDHGGTQRRGPSSPRWEEVPSAKHFSLGRCLWSASSSLASLVERPRARQ